MLTCARKCNDVIPSRPNFRPTGFSGADLYAWDKTSSQWGFLGTTMGGLSYPNASMLVEGIPVPSPAGATRIYRAHLPVSEISKKTLPPENLSRTLLDCLVPLRRGVRSNLLVVSRCDS